jgi:NAD(P)-dependent dehydrogenase (short-subunit alcohol dehydrogenase family)
LESDSQPFWLQEYNSSKSALNAVTVYFAATQRQKTPDMLVVALDPGYNATVRRSLCVYTTVS